MSEGGDGGQGGEGVDCSAWEVMYDNARKSGTSELIELSRKSLEECRARATKEVSNVPFKIKFKFWFCFQFSFLQKYLTSISPACFWSE